MCAATVIRSTLTPYFHNQRRKWYCRGTYPIRLEDGAIERRRGFIGAGHDTRSTCQADCDRLNRALEDEARKEHGSRISFAKAVVTYINMGGDARFLTEAVVEALGPLECRKIGTEIMAALAARIYPNAKPSTVNRQLYTPVLAVLNMASEGKDWAPRIRRPKGHAVRPAVKVPKDDWYAAVLPACRPELRALLLFLRIHGRRRGEALSRLPSHYNQVEHTIEIERTKNGDPVHVRLSRPVWKAIEAYDWKAGPGLFGTLTAGNARGAQRQLDRICKRLKIERHTFHPAGRHAFATEKVGRLGWSTKKLKEGAGWKSEKSAASYVHLEESDVSDDAAREGEEWASKVTKRSQVSLPTSGKSDKTTH